MHIMYYSLHYIIRSLNKHPMHYSFHITPQLRDDVHLGNSSSKVWNVYKLVLFLYQTGNETLYLVRVDNRLIIVIEGGANYYSQKCLYTQLAIVSFNTCTQCSV